MQRLPTARPRSVVLTLMIGIVWSLSLSGCDSDDGGTPMEQAKTGQEAAKSSMEYMKQRHAAQKPGSRTQSKQQSPGP
jgi:hypothetical protein